MNYIILNGKKSTMVKGLMIQSLPPITKPMIRTRIEEIDGRDGDIVTKLGYSAYDRELSIGLFGDYDIAEVMKYFDSDGEVIFSNELDRVYRYQILNQIDYERLGIFKKAVVKFHVQPFKYSSTSDAFSYTVTQGAAVNYGRIINEGNTYAKPIFEINYRNRDTQTLTVGQSVNNAGVVVGNTISINMAAMSKVLIDVENMTAYDIDTGLLVNRKISGDYSKMIFLPGVNYVQMNTYSYQMTVKKISRWI